MICDCFLSKVLYNGFPSQDLVSDETRIKFDRVREQITTIHHIISSMLQIAHNMENRSVAFSRDLKQLSSDLV